MKKVIIFAQSVSPVRRQIYEIISQYYDLTIAYTGTIAESTQYKSLKVDSKRISRFSYLKPSVSSILQSFDVAIMPIDPNKIDFDFQFVFNRKCKLIAWGIGVPASYEVRFDYSSARQYTPFYLKHADAVLFYSDYPLKKFLSMGYDKEKMFVANNTVRVNKIEKRRDRNSLLFVGSLYPAKKCEKLIEAYISLKNDGLELMPLHIIGNGSEKDRLITLSNNNGMNSSIYFHDAIYDDAVLEPYFRDAFALISPDQAGLSVLKSMGYGVPFVTTKDAYTGGERLNIINNENGILMDSLDDLKDTILDIHRNPKRYAALGEKAYDYYWANRTPKQMAQGFIDAIKYVMGE